MFNLLMFNVDWYAGRVSLPMERIFEYTDSHIAAQFRDSNNNLLLEPLTDLPCLFCKEGKGDETMYVGQIKQARISGNNLSLVLSIDMDVPPLQNSIMYINRNQLDMFSDFEFSRNYWAVKNVDLYRFLFRTVRPRRQRPTVFKIPEYENIESALVSAMMPFDSSFNDVYESIREAADNVGFRCKRADDIWENPAIIQDVVSLIDRSRIVICDCTGRNPNVFYEVGIAHTLGRDVILIAQSDHDIPFDLQHLRYIRYLNNGEGRVELKQALQDRMHTIHNIM